MNRIKKYASYLFIFLMPISISTNSIDSSKTNIDIYGDVGQYALISYNCNSGVLHKHTVPFQEIGGGVEHKLGTHVKVGANAEMIFDQQENVEIVTTPGTYEEHEKYTYSNRSTLLLTTLIRTDFKYLGAGACAFYSTHSAIKGPSKPIAFGGGFLRLGPEKFFVRASLYYDRPLFLNGFGNLGIGSRFSSRFAGWIGANIGPYDELGSLLKLAYWPKPSVRVMMIMRFGKSNNINENAVGLHVRFPLH